VQVGSSPTSASSIAAFEDQAMV